MRGVVVALAAGLATGPTTAAGPEPLPSWNAGGTKEAIVSFVEGTTRADSVDFVPLDERVAVFDNDGTLWSEQPMYVQLAFAIDRVAAMSSGHPKWRDTEPFASVLKGDFAAVAAGGEPAIAQVVATTHTGMTTVEFASIVEDWLATARHPQTGRLYTEMIYQPMLELLVYLRDNGYRTWIVSGGGTEFMRPWTERVYGIPPEQVVGSRVEVRYELRDGDPVLVKQPAVDHVDDGPGKPVGIHQAIGKRPIFAAGNSDGDFEMLEWTSARRGRHLALLVHHTDARREWAYDRDSRVGRLSRGLDEAKRRGWIVVDMANDWNTIFAAAPSRQRTTSATLSR